MKNVAETSPIPLQKMPDLWGTIKPQNGIEKSVGEAWKKKAEFLDEVSQQNNVVIFVVNPFTNRFLYMSDKLKVLSGIDPASYMAENGIDFSFSRIHPDQVEAVLLLHPFMANCYTQNEPRDSKNILLCTNFAYKNGNDEYVQVLQRTMALEVDDAGRPTLLISFGHYVGHIKKTGTVALATSTPSGIRIYDYNFDEKCIDEPKTFSEQEKKIVLLLAEGDDTKTIAKKLFISPHTVDTHRRNLIKKTNCIDTTGVVAFAKLINLI